MRWTCSHCGDTLTLSEDLIGTGWFFSKCPECSGHSLVKRLEVTVIKVNSAPPGETILHPQSRSRAAAAPLMPAVGPQSAQLFSQKAQSHLLAIPPPFRAKNSPTALPPSPLGPSRAALHTRPFFSQVFQLMIVFGIIVSLALITGSGYFFYREFRARTRIATAAPRESRDLRALPALQDDHDQLGVTQAAPAQHQDSGSQR